jgi:hypothetical protein
MEQEETKTKEMRWREARPLISQAAGGGLLESGSRKVTLKSKRKLKSVKQKQ